MSKIYDVIVLGAGPAGLTAGLYAGRSRLSTLIIEKGQDGGQIAITNEIENYPGQQLEGESGPSLIARMTEQAKKFGCEIIEVVSGGEDVQQAAFTAKDDTGIMVNSDFLNGLTVKDAIPVITKWLEEKGIGEAKVNYKLRDWVFSRQRYWGEPIPMIWCEKCGWQPVPEDQLPLLLPEVESYEPTDDGESPHLQDDRLGEHHLPLLRRPGQARDGHHAPVGRFQLVLSAVYGSPQR